MALNREGSSSRRQSSRHLPDSLSGRQSFPEAEALFATPRLKVLVLALLRTLGLAFAHVYKVRGDQASLLAEYRAKLDTDGSGAVSKAEVASWFGANLGGGAVDRASLARFGEMLAQFDANGDGDFSDTELRSFFDAMDEFPTVDAGVVGIGGDDTEDVSWVLLGIGVALVGLIALVLWEAVKTDRSVHSLKKDLEETRRAEAASQRELDSINAEHAAVAEKHRAALAARDEAVAARERHESGRSLNEAELARLRDEVRAKEAAVAAANGALGAVERRKQAAEAESEAAVAEKARLESALAGAVSNFEARREGVAVLQTFFRRSAPARGQGVLADQGATAGFVAERGRVFGSLEGSDDLWLDAGILLGKGKTSAYKVTSLVSGQAMAMKFYDMADGANRKDLETELLALRDLKRHPNVMAFEKVIETEKTFFVLMECLKGKDLFDYTKDAASFASSENDGGAATDETGDDAAFLPEDTARELFRQIFGAVAFLHDECDVIHNDLKPENIFVLDPGDGSAPVAKVIDFGLACFPGAPPRGAETSEVYAAPEFTSGAMATKAMDVYRLGVSLYSVLLGPANKPFTVNGEDGRVAWRMPVPRRSKTMAEAYPDRDPEGPRFAALSPECKALVRRLLGPVEQRPTCAEALAGPWFSNN